MERSKCVHYWVIEVAQGSYSSGTCSKCQETREFINSIYGGEGPWRHVTNGKKQQMVT